jgi:Leucine-rich repeat (LRR) protein
VFDVSDNALAGTIPAALGQFTNATSFFAYRNHQPGAVPPELGNLTGVFYLYVADNLLSGTLPPSLSQLRALIELSCEKNRLSGSLTRLFDGTQPPKLKTRSLGSNQFTGPLPAVLSELRRLQTS